jgi:flagellar assembly factor FliW
MQSMTQPGLCFLALPVQIVQPEYRLRMSAEDLQAIGLPSDRQPELGSQVLCLALLSLSDQQPPTANLLSPVVVNLSQRKAVQAIQCDVEYSHCHPLASAAREVLCS